MKSITLPRAVLSPWAILPQNLAVIVEIVSRHFAGEKLDPEEVQMRIHGAVRPADRRTGSVAILPLFGTIFPRANLFTNTSGATSAEMFGKAFGELVRNPDIAAIVIDVDSPGGEASGIDEVSKQIYDARGSKPIVAVANHLAASAAYWIATAADELVVTPSAQVGSIGVFAIHEDISKALENEGIKVTLISEGKFKTAGNPYEPLSDEARDYIQKRVSEVYEAFVKTVARNRGIKPDAVRNGFGEGRVVNAREAVSLGMADRIATLDETIERLQRGSARKPAASADTDFRRRRMRLVENTGSVEPVKPLR